MRKAIGLSVFFLSVLLFTDIARAEGYLGAGVGSSNASFNSSDFGLGLPQVAESADRASVAGKVFAGYRFNKNFCAEVAYVDLGKFKYKYDGGASGSAAIDYKVSGFAVSGIVAFPVAVDFAVFGRIGAFASTAKASLASASGSVGNALTSAGVAAGSGDTARKTTLQLGVGARYDFSGGISGRVEYENFGEVGDTSESGRTTVSLISASLLLRF